MKNLLFALLTVCTIGLYSCGDSCDTTSLVEDANDSGVLAQAYLGESTTANCEAYAEKLQSIIDDYSDCEGDEFTTQVVASQVALDLLPCK